MLERLLAVPGNQPALLLPEEEGYGGRKGERNETFLTVLVVLF
jgi:hypothetical protein